LIRKDIKKKCGNEGYAEKPTNCTNCLTQPPNLLIFFKWAYNHTFRDLPWTERAKSFCSGSRPSPVRNF